MGELVFGGAVVVGGAVVGGKVVPVVVVGGRVVPVVATGGGGGVVEPVLEMRTMNTSRRLRLPQLLV